MEQFSDWTFGLLEGEVPLSVWERIVVAQRYKCSITFRVEFRLYDLNYLLKGGGNFLLADPRIVVGSAVASPEQIRIFRCYLVYLIENVLECVLWDVTRVWAVGWRTPLACFYRAFSSFRLLSTAVSKSTVGCSSYLVLSIEMCIREVNESNPLTLAKRLLLILFVNKAMRVSCHPVQNECNVLIKRNRFVNFLTNFDRLWAKVLWRKYELSESWNETLGVEVVAVNTLWLEKELCQLESCSLQLALNHLNGLMATVTLELAEWLVRKTHI